MGGKGKMREEKGEWKGRGGRRNGKEEPSLPMKKIVPALQMSLK